MKIGSEIANENGTNSKNKKLWRYVLAASLFAASVFIARFDSPLQAQVKPSISFEQCSNSPETCDSAHESRWETGNLGSHNSSYEEGQSVPFRAVFESLTIGDTYKVTLEWDTTENGKHSFDYLTSFDRTETTADPCVGYTCSGSTNTLAVPMDPVVAGASVTQLPGQFFKIRGATFPGNGSSVPNTGDLCGTATCSIALNPSAYGHSGDYTGSSSASITIHFTATSATAVLAWGGHIATRSDWGTDASAAAISGSNYHMRLHDFACSGNSNCNTGNMDRSMSSSAVVLPGSITIVKQASTEGSASFSFTASPSPLTNFSLVDDGTVANTRAFTGITAYGTYTVTEESKSLWGFDRASCSVLNSNGGSQTVDGRTATIVLAEGENVTCTYYNSLLPVPGLSLDKTANVSTYSEIGDVVTYTYKITNSGETTLGPDQFMVDDDRINGGAPFNCGAADVVLDPTEFVTCTAQYTIGSADITSESVTNTAFATGADLTTTTDSVTVNFVPPESTTTTTSTTSTTTTTLPGATTTTTVAPTTTAPAVTTTTSPTNLQVIVGPSPDDALDVLLPEELPATGIRAGAVSLGLLGLLLLGGLMVSVGTTRRSRHRKIGGNR